MADSGQLCLLKQSHQSAPSKEHKINMQCSAIILFFIQICVMIRWLNWPTVKFQVSSIQKDIKMMLLGEKWQKRTFLTFSTLYHFLDSLGLPLTVLCHTIGKFTTLQKFWVTAMVLSKFRTTCHQPPGTNTVSPGPWRISSC